MESSQSKFTMIRACSISSYTLFSPSEIRNYSEHDIVINEGQQTSDNVRRFVQSFIKTMRNSNRKNPPNSSNLHKQWRPISLEAPAPVIHRSTEGSLDVRGKSRSKHLIRNHNFKGGYVNQGLDFLKALHVG